jgi:hypothetical protein
MPRDGRPRDGAVRVSVVFFAVVVRVICFKYHGKGLGATQVGGLEPGEACILWLRRDETAPGARFQGLQPWSR